MLDLKLLQKNPEVVAAALAKRHSPLNMRTFEELDNKRRELLAQVEALKAERNRASVHLVFRAVHLMIVFSPTVLTSWILFVPSLRVYWYRLLVATLQVTGSLFMKLGQWASTRPDILPIELCKRLSTLHSTTKCVDYPIMFRTIERELGKPVNEVFDTIIETPVGSGCIAQVYKARLRGSSEWVAIKVKRPNVDESFTRDLQLVNFFARCISVIPFTQYIAPVLTAELFTKAVQQQLDFRIEAINLIHFNDNFRVDFCHGDDA